MGKWSTIKTHPNFEVTEKAVRAMTATEIDTLWNGFGCQTLADFDLHWYWGSSGDGWRCIDNSIGASTFQMFCPRNSPNDYEEKVAVIVARRLDIKNAPTSIPDVKPSVKCEPIGVTYFLFNVSQIVQNDALEVDRHYWVRDKETGEISIVLCGKNALGKYLNVGTHMSTNIWAFDGNDQAFDRWEIIGPIPRLTDSTFTKVIDILKKDKQ